MAPAWATASQVTARPPGIWSFFSAESSYLSAPQQIEQAILFESHRAFAPSAHKIDAGGGATFLLFLWPPGTS